MILACHNLSKSFGDQVIVKDGSFHIENHEKAALVGLNGAGKSTILKMIVGQLSPDAGTVVLTKGKTLGYLAQHQEMESGNTIYEEVRTAKAEVIEMEKQIRTIEIELPSLSGDALEARLATYQRLTSAFEHADGYAYKSELTGVLKGLGFTEEEFTKPVDSLSGGQKTRVSLGKLLLTKPDVLLLDEPTNHLDMNSIAWLETYLLNYPGAVLIVSHDRYFLNRVVTKVIEVEQGQLHTYMGNYSDFAVKKEQLREARLKEYLNQQREIKHQQAVIDKLKSFNREKSIKRAGMDYWDDLDVTRYIDYQDFLEKNPGAKIYMASTKAPQTYTEVQYEEDAYIMFGKESGGIPEEILLENQETAIRIPMMNDIRSLNLSNSVAIVLYEALRQHNFDHMQLGGHLTRYEWK